MYRSTNSLENVIGDEDEEFVTDKIRCETVSGKPHHLKPHTRLHELNHIVPRRHCPR